MSEAASPADAVLRATRHARALGGRPVVVKLGGSAMEDPAATRGMVEAVVALQTLGVRMVLVHGGGKPIDRAMAAAGLEPKKVAGRRYTDDATLEIVVRVLGELNREIVDRIAAAGGSARSVTLPKDFPIRGERLLLPGLDLQPVELGRVGKPTEIAVEVGATIPVLPSLAIAEDGGWLNVNADTAAAGVAGAIKAEACYFLTDTPGVLRDVKDPKSLLTKLSRAECEQLIRDGVIAGGMVPKVEACFEALDAGAGSAVILDGRDPHALLARFVDRPAGTAIVP